MGRVIKKVRERKLLRLVGKMDRARNFQEKWKVVK